MNDKRIKHTLLSALATLLLFSCSQEELPGVDNADEDSGILFFTSLPGVQTRSADNIDNTTIKDGFNVSAGWLENLDAAGKPSMYFENELVKQTAGMGEAFRSDKCRWPSNKGANNGKLRFFAFYPSLDVLSDSAGIDRNSGYFQLTYNLSEDKTRYEYWIKKFKVSKDITRHSDFVTATKEGSKTDNLYSGVNLSLQHQLSRIILEAYGSSEAYDVEIAGVRIGGIATESDFSFEGVPVNYKDWNSTKVGRWIGVGQNRGCVEYIFRKGDTVVPIGKGRKHETYETAVSIMGNGGSALVIPYDYYVWKDYSNKENRQQDYLYLSVLLRVKEKATPNNTLLYPYIEGTDIKPSATPPATAGKMNVVYLSIETETGKVMRRVYKKGSDFYTSPDCSAASLYNVPKTEDVRNYGWASAVPNTGNDPQIRWNPGYQYYYRLDYSNGIGVQDPADALPGKPIIAPVDVTGTKKQWHEVKDYENVDITDVEFTIK